MEKRHQFAMLASIVHIVNGDWASLVYDLAEMDVISPGTNIQRFSMVVSISEVIWSFHKYVLCFSLHFRLLSSIYRCSFDSWHLKLLYSDGSLGYV